MKSNQGGLIEKEKEELGKVGSWKAVRIIHYKYLTNISVGKKLKYLGDGDGEGQEQLLVLNA